MSKTIFVALVSILMTGFSAHASASKYSELTAAQQSKINDALVKFLPAYANAIDIALYNINKDHVGTMDASAPFGTMSVKNGTADQIFTEVENLFGGIVSMKGFATARGAENFTQASDEMKQAKGLAFQLSHHDGDKTAWMNTVDSELTVVSDVNEVATVKVEQFARPNCEILASTDGSIQQSCN